MLTDRHTLSVIDYYTIIDFHGGEYRVILTPIFMILSDLWRAEYDDLCMIDLCI